MDTKEEPNELIHEKSPYLLQHAYNPVKWYPWGEKAFDLAKKEDKPIFLSIGYSTCHWCHVMAHESFEDKDVAELMNDAFICIKVDREERPDIDNVYMRACQMMTGMGGWPLTIIMTPNKKPFVAATYLPKKSRFGRVGMMELVPHVTKRWKKEKEAIVKYADQATVKIASLDKTAGANLDEVALEQTYQAMLQTYDKTNGGFGKAPKFPSPHQYTFLLRYWKRTSNAPSLDIVTNSLQKMSMGGMFDHLGYGFHRYSTDSKWILPHFEKMLYDQATLLTAFVETYQATGEEYFAQVGRKIIEYLKKDLTSSEGAFYSAEDADSEGVEGKYYVWKTKEVEEILEKEEYEWFSEVYNLKSSGNFEDEATGRKTRENILYQTSTLDRLAEGFNITVEELSERLRQSHEKMLKYREKRIRPGLDEKILTDWNGLMIAALAKASRAFEDEEIMKSAMRACDFILENLRDKDGELYHVYIGGEKSQKAFLDDYAFLIWGMIELYQASFKEIYLKEAVRMTSYCVNHFWDGLSGGFFFTSNNAEQQIVRSKESFDSAIPSGNSVMMKNLLYLAHFTGDHTFERYAERVLISVSGIFERRPQAFSYLMSSLSYALGPTHQITIAGKQDDKETQEFIQKLNKEFLPGIIVVLRKEDDPEARNELDAIAKYTKEQGMKNEKLTIYLCTKNVCDEPTNDANEVIRKLKG